MLMSLMDRGNIRKWAGYFNIILAHHHNNISDDHLIFSGVGECLEDFEAGFFCELFEFGEMFDVVAYVEGC